MKKIWAFIVAFFVFWSVGLSIRIIGPMIAGVTIVVLGIEPIGSQDIKTLESLGNMVNLVFSGYLSYKVFKKIAKVK